MEKLWIPPKEIYPDSKIQVRVYLRHELIKHYKDLTHAMQKIRLLVPIDKISSAIDIQRLVLCHRPVLRGKDYTIFYNIPGRQLRPRNIYCEKDNFFADQISLTDNRILELHVDLSPSSLSNLPKAPSYFKDMPEPSLSEQYSMVSFFTFKTIRNPSTMAKHLNKLWSPFRALGRVYVATEGINAQMAVPSNVLDRFEISFGFVDCLDSVEVNVDEEIERKEFEEYLPFYKLHIRPKERLVADGGLDLSVRSEHIGQELTAQEWHERVDSPGAIVIDCRNKFESDIGRFQNAISLSTQVFRDSWRALEGILKDKSKDTPILTYCTGGIRCVKTNAFITQKLGFTDVSRLKGGIINYSKYISSLPKGTKFDSTGLDISKCRNGKSIEDGNISKFIGVNYVFDERVCRRITDDVLTTCSSCGKPCDFYSNCSNNSNSCSVS